MLVKEGGYCGERGELFSTEVSDAAACSYLAQGAGAQAFLLGTRFSRGYCFTATMSVDEAQFSAWEAVRLNPTCSAEGGFTNSRIWDFYAIASMCELHEEFS